MAPDDTAKDNALDATMKAADPSEMPETDPTELKDSTAESLSKAFRAMSTRYEKTTA